MSIKKQFVKTKPVCKVTFVLAGGDALKASVVGDFNSWDASAGALTKLKNGNFKGVFDLSKDATYEFKYLVDDAYVNEEEADDYVWNEFAGSENSVLVV
ncbi:isoamylase early set domain-containing protein [Flavobacterium frigidarium]|jgi:1,4-alpha-glucan branching enzyme|uniref:isoamylase early set domain-containing protein n=1 Tax=Flavobacterium frigidarium TaxID=99286 RepID=UPI00041116D9|nr:isoamylase early set domain-containing protein [Flavobacterium frigidarium]